MNWIIRNTLPEDRGGKKKHKTTNLCWLMKPKQSTDSAVLQLTSRLRTIHLPKCLLLLLLLFFLKCQATNSQKLVIIHTTTTLHTV